LRGLLAFIGGAAILYLAFKSIGNYVSNNLSLVKTSIKTGSITASGIPLVVALHIQNKTNLAIPIDGFSGGIFYDNNEIAPVEINSTVTIQPNKVSIVQIDSFINFLNISSTIKNLIASGQLLAGLNLKGDLRFEGVNVPINHSISLFG